MANNKPKKPIFELQVQVDLKDGQAVITATFLANNREGQLVQFFLENQLQGDPTAVNAYGSTECLINTPANGKKVAVAAQIVREVETRQQRVVELPKASAPAVKENNIIPFNCLWLLVFTVIYFLVNPGVRSFAAIVFFFIVFGFSILFLGDDVREAFRNAFRNIREKRQQSQFNITDAWDEMVGVVGTLLVHIFSLRGIPRR